jgi:hypothetical protein
MSSPERAMGAARLLCGHHPRFRDPSSQGMCPRGPSPNPSAVSNRVPGRRSRSRGIARSPRHSSTRAGEASADPSRSEMEAGIACARLTASAVRPIRAVRDAQAHFYNWHAKGKCHRFRSTFPSPAGSHQKRARCPCDRRGPRLDSARQRAGGVGSPVDKQQARF